MGWLPTYFGGILQVLLIDPIRFKTKGMMSRIPQGNTDYTFGIQSGPAQHGGERGLEGPVVKAMGSPTCWVGVYLTVWE